MGRSKDKPPLPLAGESFAFPLGDGRFSACRVLLDATSEQSKRWGTGPILVACSAWIGDSVPTIDTSGLRTILRLSHHSWQDKLAVQWVGDEPPADFISIGTITPLQQEQSLPCNSFGNWQSLTIQPLMQWRWDKERDAVLAEDVHKDKQEAERRKNQQRQRAEYLRQVTLGKLHEHLFFARWIDYPPAKAVEASRAIMANTVEQLAELGVRASKKKRMAVLQACIESFNNIDAKLHFIETAEREDICEEFEAIVHACGLGDEKDLADRWREW